MFSEVILFVKTDRYFDLIEWINYYNKIGFDHIVIYDNESSINIRNICKSYNIEYHKITGFINQSALMKEHYNNTLADWIYFADLDEFLWFDQKKYKNINDAITKKSEELNTDIIGIYWIKISNYRAIKSRADSADTTQIKTFKYINPLFEHESWLKLIYKTNKQIDNFNVHYITPYNLIKTVSNNTDFIIKKYNYLNDDFLIYHYFFRSYDEYYYKLFNTVHINKNVILNKLYNIKDFTFDEYNFLVNEQQYIKYTNNIYNILYDN